MEEPLTPKILSNPDHEFTKRIIYIYSMECFVFKEMNKTSRAKDKLMVSCYGALGSALSFIIHSGNKAKAELPDEVLVYRGL